MKTWMGKVISNKNDKTAIVAIESYYAHPLYGKRGKRTKRYAVHDEIGVSVGDRVHVVESKSLSKTKRWKITDLVKVKNSKKGKKK